MVMRLRKQINQIHYQDFGHWFNKPNVKQPLTRQSGKFVHWQDIWLY